MSEAIICKNCGTPNTEGKFCVSCGSPLPVAPQPVQPQPVQPQPVQYQPTYSAPPPVQQQPEPQQPVVVVNNIRNYNTKWDYTPIKAWGYFGLNILFAIPLVGLVFLLIFALGGTKRINLRNYARSFFCSLILVAVLVAVILIFGASLSRYFANSPFINFEYNLFPGM